MKICVEVAVRVFNKLQPLVVKHLHIEGNDESEAGRWLTALMLEMQSSSSTFVSHHAYRPLESTAEVVVVWVAELESHCLRWEFMVPRYWSMEAVVGYDKV